MFDQNNKKRKHQVLPTALLGEIVQYLDITSDRFLPGFRNQWIKATRFETDDLILSVYHRVNDQVHSWHGRPAIQWANGDREWFCRGQRHKSHGLPARIASDGYREFWIHGKQIHAASTRFFSTLDSFVTAIFVFISIWTLFLLFHYSPDFFYRVFSNTT